MTNGNIANKLSSQPSLSSLLDLFPVGQAEEIEEGL